MFFYIKFIKLILTIMSYLLQCKVFLIFTYIIYFILLYLLSHSVDTVFISKVSQSGLSSQTFDLRAAKRHNNATKVKVKGTVW